MSQATQHFFTTKDLSERWQISSRTLEGWREKGIGPTYRKIGVNVRYHIDDVEKFEGNWHSNVDPFTP